MSFDRTDQGIDQAARERIAREADEPGFHALVWAIVDEVRRQSHRPFVTDDELIAGNARALAEDAIDSLGLQGDVADAVRLYLETSFINTRLDGTTADPLPVTTMSYPETQLMIPRIRSPKRRNWRE